jgi:hypothetical protein
MAALIYQGDAEARKYRFPAIRGENLMAKLMFVLGHGCADDPLYPWVARTLRDEKVSDPAIRIDRLEKESLAWLGQIVSSPRKGART